MSVTTVETFTCTVCSHRFEAADLPTECPKCRVHGSARNFPSDKTATTARQNDSFRAGMIVSGCPFPGTVVVTSGVRDRGRDFVTGAILAAAFDTEFFEDNDPWGTRDFGTVTVQGEKLYWKIDYYDADREYGSDDPSDPAKTHRVLTILFPSEY